MPDETIQILTREGRTWRANRAKVEEMDRALVAALPDAPPGLTVAEAMAALLPTLDPGMFPGGGTAGWWMNVVQIDHEARGTIRRGRGSPLKLFRSGA